ncbi:hypothetical protein D6833_11810, partial [Candidatus Parcubacteria bacterium]
VSIPQSGLWPFWLLSPGWDRTLSARSFSTSFWAESATQQLSRLARNPWAGPSLPPAFILRAVRVLPQVPMHRTVKFLVSDGHCGFNCLLSSASAYGHLLHRSAARSLGKEKN